MANNNIQTSPWPPFKQSGNVIRPRKSGSTLMMGTGTPDSSAELQLDSTTKGFLPNRVTTAQMNAIVAPATGLIVYNTDDSSLYQYDGASWVQVGGSTVDVSSTSKWYVDGQRGDDLTATGSLDLPYKTIQACLDAIGQPVNGIDFKKHIELYISDSLTATNGVSGSWNAVYTENLVFPHRCMTVYGRGVKINGTVTREISDAREWGTSSSDFRGCITFVGLVNCRDSQQRLRNGFHIGGTTRTKAYGRNIVQIQGDGVNKITVDTSNYQIDIGIRLVVQNTVNYNALYDVITKNSSTQFVAQRVSGTNASVAIENVGNFYETDAAGSTQTTSDMAFYNTYVQGEYSSDDGTNNGGATSVGGNVLYLENCRTFAGINGTTITCQRFINNELAGTNIVGSMVSVERNVFGGTWSVNGFTNSSTDMHWLNNQFSAAVPITVRSAGQTVNMDGVTYGDFIQSGSSWVTNTPTIVLMDRAGSIRNDSTVSGTTVKDALDTLAASSIDAVNVLSTTTGIDLKTVAATTLYTVPAGKTAYITGVKIRLTTATAVTVPAQVGVGVAAGEDDILAVTTLTNLLTTGKHYTIWADGISANATATQVIKLGVDVGATATTATAAVDLIGYLL